MLRNIKKDIDSGALPKREIPGFLFYLIKGPAQVLFWGAVLATIAWLLTH
jgi:hypothetical protein